MTSLLDIGPLTETISVRGVDIEVRGLSPESFFILLSSFPALRGLASVQDLDGESLYAAVPACIGKAIALATTDREQFATMADWMEHIQAVEKKARQMGMYDQLRLLNSAITMTFPEGVGPFVDQINLLTGAVNEARGQVSATTSPKSRRRGFTSDSPGMRLGRAAPSGSSTH